MDISRFPGVIYWGVGAALPASPAVSWAAPLAMPEGELRPGGDVHRVEGLASCRWQSSGDALCRG